MPTFIDHHDMSDLAPEVAAASASGSRPAQADENGVKGLNVFLGKDGTAFCLSEAPDAEAVVNAHQDVWILARLGRRRRGAERRLGHYGTRVPLLTGTRVLACENGLAGPLCTRLLADLGADVIKVERPGVGDVTRGWDSIARGQSSGFVWMNRGKRSVALDLKDDASRPALEALIRASDVFLQNFTPGWAASTASTSLPCGRSSPTSSTPRSPATGRTAPTPSGTHTTSSSRAKRGSSRSPELLRSRRAWASPSATWEREATRPSPPPPPLRGEPGRVRASGSPSRSSTRWSTGWGTSRTSGGIAARCPRGQACAIRISAPTARFRRPMAASSASPSFRTSTGGRSPWRS